MIITYYFIKFSIIINILNFTYTYKFNIIYLKMYIVIIKNYFNKAVMINIIKLRYIILLYNNIIINFKI